MKYFKVNIERIFNTKEEVIGHANGQFVSNGKYYFDRIGKKEIYFKSLCYTSNFDWVTGYKRSENLCSERLKTAIEQMGLEGILFSEVEYEILIA